MQITQKKEADCLTISLEGRVDSVSSGDFQAYLDENFTSDVQKLILDFSGVDFISSKGLRILVSLYKNLNGRSMVILKPNASVLEVLRLSGLLNFFQIEQ